jgi:hypothetical protein
MAAPAFFARWSAFDRTAEMAERVSGRSRMAVWQRVKEGLAGLDPVEARGYIRARALPIVKDETSRLIEQEGQRVARRREVIIRAATESLICTMVAQRDERAAAATLRRAA